MRPHPPYAQSPDGESSTPKVDLAININDDMVLSPQTSNKESVPENHSAVPGFRNFPAGIPWSLIAVWYLSQQRIWLGRSWVSEKMKKVQL